MVKNFGLLSTQFMRFDGRRIWVRPPLLLLIILGGSCDAQFCKFDPGRFLFNLRDCGRHVAQAVPKFVGAVCGSCPFTRALQKRI